MQQSRETVVLVDEDDSAVGEIGKLEAHRSGALHRALSVIIVDDGRLLLQKRAATKYHSGNLWTNTCCSHPRPGEPIGVAAARRLREEMGFSTPLSPLFTTRYRAAVSNGLVENELVHVFGGRFSGTPRPDPLEVAAWRWASLDEIVEDIGRRAEHYSVWFRTYLDTFGTAIGDLVKRA